MDGFAKMSLKFCEILFKSFGMGLLQIRCVKNRVVRRGPLDGQPTAREQNTVRHCSRNSDDLGPWATREVERWWGVVEVSEIFWN